MRKKNMKSKKYKSTGNEVEEHNQWITESGFPHAKKAIEDYWTRCLSQNL